jgi:hypothetical protein
MGFAPPIILKIETPEMHKVVIDTNDGYRYHSNLATFSKVYCYPPSKKEWDLVSVDSYGMGIIWASRFEVHVDQIIGLAEKVEKLEEAS